jgi:hypothetical protein
VVMIRRGALRGLRRARAEAAAAKAAAEAVPVPKPTREPAETMT